MHKIIAIANPKGGVGKTTTTINLAASLAIAEKRVLVVDLDPNGAVGFGLELNAMADGDSIFEVLLGTAELPAAIHKFELPPFDVVPCQFATIEQENRFIELAGSRGILRTKFQDLIRREKFPYDFVLLDTPPIMNNVTLMALSAASSVLIPLQCGYYALQVVGKMLDAIQRIKNSQNPTLEIEGILLNVFDRRTRESAMAESEVRRHFGDYVFDTIIPKNAVIGFSAFKKKPVALVDALAPGAIAFMELAKEIILRNLPETAKRPIPIYIDTDLESASPTE